MSAAAQGAALVAGPWFEDFEVGLTFDAPAVTLHGGHAALYQALFGDRLRLPLDAAMSARVTGRSQGALAHPLLVINLAVGQSTWASQRVKANLFYRGLVLRRPVFLGDTLHTETRVVGRRLNKLQAGRPATGVVALEMRTTNQHGELVLHFWRCPMIPCRDPQLATGPRDDLDRIGTPVDVATLSPLLEDWNLEPAIAGWRGLRAEQLTPGSSFAIESRDSVTCAPELVRLTLNMAMAHTDAKLSYLGERLVYGGHVISMAFSQVTRALPNLLTMLAWESADHLAPVLENDRLRSELTLDAAQPLERNRGALLRVSVRSYAARGEPEQESRVLDWTFWALGI